LSPLSDAGAQILVVDGGSSDASCAVAEEMGAHVIVSDKGRARQMNAGARLATGKTILFLHADSYPDQHWCQSVLLLLGGASWGFFRPRLIGRSIWLRLIAWFMWQRSRLTGIGTGDQCLWVRRAVFRGDVFPEQALMEDIEFCKRAKRTANPLAIPVFLGTSARRWEQKGLLRTVLLMWSLRLRYWLGASPDTLRRSYYD